MKRFLALVLLVTCLTSLVACGGNAQNATTTAGTSAATTTAASTEATTTEAATTAVTTTTAATTTTQVTTVSTATTAVTTTTAATTTATTSAATTTSTTAATTVATTATTAATTIATTAQAGAEVSAYDALCSDIELLYTGMGNDLPALFNTEITAENMSYYLGVDNIDMIAGVASEPMMSSIAFSVCLIQVADGADIEGIKADIEENVDPRKWCCVEAENVIVDSIGSKIVLIMCNEPAETIHANFTANIQ